MKDIKFFKEIIFNFKGILFRNRDIISGVELVEYGIVSKDTKNILKSLKKLRKLNNIYYVWDYNKEFKKLIFSYKYNRKKIMAKLIISCHNYTYKLGLKSSISCKSNHYGATKVN